MTRSERKAFELETAFNRYLERVKAAARMRGEGMYDRRMPARKALIDAFVTAAVNSAKATEHARRAAIVAQKTTKPVVILATAAPAAKPTATKCVVLGRLAIPVAVSPRRPPPIKSRQPTRPKPVAAKPAPVAPPPPSNMIYVARVGMVGARTIVRNSLRAVTFEEAALVEYESPLRYHPAMRAA